MTKKILVVDDEFDDLSSVKNILTKEGYSVSTATNGAQAIDMIAINRFDLIMLDIRMPTLSGYDILRLLKERVNGGTKMIYVSIVPKLDVEMDGVEAFVQKPFSPETLIKEVKRVLK